MLDRVFGETLKISVGTALAIERLLKEEKSLKVEYLYINVRTLFRNLHEAFEDHSKLNPSLLAKELGEEMELIKSVVETKVVGNMEVVFYICSNKSMHKIFSEAKLKLPHTDKQKEYEHIERTTMEGFIDNYPLGKTIKIFDCLVKGSNSTALILTHFPMELLSASTFRTLKLIESHTGVIKEKMEWITKLDNDPEYQNIPFNALSLQLLGDGAIQFYRGNVKFLKLFKEVATKNKWHAGTTASKVKFDLDKHWDKLFVNYCTDLLYIKLK